MTMVGLQFELGAPLALWGLAAALPITLLHLYFRRRKRVLVPFVPLLAESRGPVRREARFKRLRDATALFARLLGLAAAVFALGGLRPVEAHRVHADVFLVIDADVTTAAREEAGVLRLGRGLALAQDWVRSIDRTGERGERLEVPVSVFLAEATPRLLLAPTKDRALALRTLGQLPAPAPSSTDLGAALGMALDAAARSEKAEIVLLTSRAFAAPRELPAGVRLTVQGMGTTRENQGIVGFVVERLRDEPAYRVRLAVRNDAATKRERTLRIQIGDEVVDEKTAQLEPGPAIDVELQVPAPREGTWLTCSLPGNDRFPADDRVDAWLSPLPRPSVLVVHGGAVRPYTSAVLAALAAEGSLDEERSGFVSARNFAKAAARDVTIVDGVAVPAGTLRPGAYVFIGPLAGRLPFETSRAVKSPLIWRTEANHPLMRDLDFRRAFVVQGQAVRGPGMRSLAFAEGLPVIAEGERDGVRYVVMGLDPQGSALPAQAAWPRFLRNAILRLAVAPVAPLKPFYHSGDVLRPLTSLPGGPDANVAWEGPVADAVLRPQWRGQRSARIDPGVVAWHVPPGASGRCAITTGEGDNGWTGHTGLFDGDAERTIVPARPAGQAPGDGVVHTETGTAWRRGLIAAALLLLLLDLALTFHRRKPKR